MKKFFKIILISLIIGSYGLLHQPAQAQLSIFQKTVESIENLIKVKDENPESLAFRIQAFNEVIDLSLAEVKELKIKLLALENLDATSTQWQETKVNKLNEIINYYESQKTFLNSQKTISLEEIKTTAQEFKKWREENYLPLANLIWDFILLHKEKKALETAQTRFQKISLDLENLKNKNLKGLENVFEYLSKADKKIKEARDLNEQAVHLFWLTALSSTTVSSPLLISSSTNLSFISSTLETVSSTATSSPIKEELILKPSIRDLIDLSLKKIKEAYQIFIEMSNIVRVLLR